MAITIQLPPGVEEELRRQDPKLDEKARDEFLIANYQAGKLSTSDIAEILGFETRMRATGLARKAERADQLHEGLP